MQKNKRKPARKKKTKHGEPRKELTPHRAPRVPQNPRSPHRAASPETTIMSFTICQFTLTSNMLTHISSQKHLSAIL